MEQPKPCPFCGVRLREVRQSTKWVHPETGQCFVDHLAVGGSIGIPDWNKRVPWTVDYRTAADALSEYSADQRSDYPVMSAADVIEELGGKVIRP